MKRILFILITLSFQTSWSQVNRTQNSANDGLIFFSSTGSSVIKDEFFSQSTYEGASYRFGFQFIKTHRRVIHSSFFDFGSAEVENGNYTAIVNGIYWTQSLLYPLYQEDKLQLLLGPELGMTFDVRNQPRGEFRVFPSLAWQVLISGGFNLDLTYTFTEKVSFKYALHSGILTLGSRLPDIGTGLDVVNFLAPWQGNNLNSITGFEYHFFDRITAGLHYRFQYLYILPSDKMRSNDGWYSYKSASDQLMVTLKWNFK